MSSYNYRTGLGVLAGARISRVRTWTSPKIQHAIEELPKGMPVHKTLTLTLLLAWIVRRQRLPDRLERLETVRPFDHVKRMQSALQ